MKNYFCENLKMYRKELKLSQLELSKRVGVTQQCISEWEKGSIEPTLSYLCKLADVFEISIDELVGRDI